MKKIFLKTAFIMLACFIVTAPLYGCNLGDGNNKYKVSEKKWNEIFSSSKFAYSTQDDYYNYVIYIQNNIVKKETYNSLGEYGVKFYEETQLGFYEYIFTFGGTWKKQIISLAEKYNVTDKYLIKYLDYDQFNYDNSTQSYYANIYYLEGEINRTYYDMNVHFKDNALKKITYTYQGNDVQMNFISNGIGFSLPSVS